MTRSASCGAPIELLYCDPALVAIHKPAGLLVHRTELDTEARRFALQLVREAIGERVYAVHRLDRGTSGVMVFARTPQAQARLAGSFQRHEVDKTYLALVRGWPAASGSIDYPLRRLSGPAMAPAQAARTEYVRLAQCELAQRVDRYETSRYALLRLHPDTGRQHQLRRHLSHVSHPIIGDTTYGQGRHNRLFRVQFECRRLLLAAVELCFAHPSEPRTLRIAAPLSGDFQRVLDRLGIGDSVPEAWRGVPAWPPEPL